MERFALAAAVVLGFALTAALCSLFVPLRRVLERREQQQQPVQSEQPRPAPLRAPLWGGLCAAAGTVAAVGVGWLAACVGQPELLGSEGQLMTRLLTALAGSLAFGAVGLAEDVARMRSPAALGLRRDVRLLLEALAAAFVLLLLRAAGCLPRADDAPGLRPGEDGGDGACVLIEGAVELQGLAAVYIQHTDHGTVPASGAGDLKDWGSGVRGGELIGEQIALRAALKGDGGKDAA